MKKKRIIAIGNIIDMKIIIYFFIIIVSVTKLIAEISVTAELAQENINLSDSTELRLEVKGTSQTSVPNNISIDGLQIILQGQSSQIQIINGTVSSSVVYNYLITPTRTGNFNIPTIFVKINDKQFQTGVLHLNVKNEVGSVASPSCPIVRQGISSHQTAFAEIYTPKKTLYLGEVVPLEIKFFFNANNQVQLMSNLKFQGENILIDKFSDPKESKEQHEGIWYNVLTYNTSFSAIKTGSVKISPVSLKCAIQTPNNFPSGLDRADQQLIQQLFGNTISTTPDHLLLLKTESINLNILPLPSNNVPSTFGGAVGQFMIDVLVPRKINQPGDPVSFKVVIHGYGNFKQMNPPILTETNGWHIYPPTIHTENSGTTSNSKVIFDYTMLAEETHNNSPGVEFSFFDPLKNRYFTILKKPIPLVATPILLRNASSLEKDESKFQTHNDSKISSTDITNKYHHDISNQSSWIFWKKFFLRKEFLIALLALFIVLLGIVSIFYLYFKDKLSRLNLLQKKWEMDKLWFLINTNIVDPVIFYQNVIDYVKLARKNSEEHADLLKILVENYEKYKYGSEGPSPLSPNEKSAILSLIQHLKNS